MRLKASVIRSSWPTVRFSSGVARIVVKVAAVRCGAIECVTVLVPEVVAAIGISPSRSVKATMIDASGCKRYARQLREFRLRQGIDRPDSLRFVSGYGRVLFQDIAQLVDTFEQTVFGEGVDGEFDRGSIGQR